MALYKTCSRCSIRIPYKEKYCDSCKTKAAAERSKRKAKRLDSNMYNTQRWRLVRDSVLNDCNYMCLYTYYKEGKVVQANCVHHVIELLEDNSLAYDEDNLIALSNDAHKLIHELYKEDKLKVQEELREMKYKWINRNDCSED